jgi:hypothetical protein
MSVVLRDSNGHDYAEIVGKEGAVSVMTAGATSSQSAAFGDSTTLIRVAVAGANLHVHYLIGTSPTATTTTCSSIPSGRLLFLSVAPGQKIAFIRGGATDVAVTVTEIV